MSTSGRMPPWRRTNGPGKRTVFRAVMKGKHSKTLRERSGAAPCRRRRWDEEVIIADARLGGESMRLSRRVFPGRFWVASLIAVTISVWSVEATPEAPVATPSAPASLVTVPDDVPAHAARYAVLLAGNEAGVFAK